MAYLNLQRFREITVMPGADVDQLEYDYPNWIDRQCASVSAWMDGLLGKRYAIGTFAAPYPFILELWCAKIVTANAYLMRGSNQTDAQVAFIFEEAKAAKTEVKEAADSKEGLYELPLRQDTSTNGISRGTPLASSNAGPFRAQYLTAQRARDEWKH